MALKQKITNKSGAITEYHRISSATGDLTSRRAYITVLSYLNSGKRDEEKLQAAKSIEQTEMRNELDNLNLNPTQDNESERTELEDQLSALATEIDGNPRNILQAHYEFSLPKDSTFSLELAYNWLKENIYTDSEDC